MHLPDQARLDIMLIGGEQIWPMEEAEMLRTKLFAGLFALGLSFTPASAQTQNAFRYDGNTYKYMTVADGNLIRLSGVVVETGEKFELRVSESGRVRGEFGVKSVSFRVNKRVRDNIAARLAAADRLASGVEVSTR